MIENTFYTSLLLSGAFGFMENLYIQLQDCCKYKDQGVIIIVDREGQDYEAMEKNNFKNYAATPLDLHQALTDGKNALIVASKTIATALKKLSNHYAKNPKSTFAGWKIYELEDFYIFTHQDHYNSYEDINFKQFIVKTWDEVEQYTPATKNATPIHTILSRIFISPVSKSSPINSWMIYLTGHGLPRKFIAGLEIDEFQKFLDFFAKNVFTKIFIYDSCYAGGFNKQLAFEEDIDININEDTFYYINKSYSFPIITLSSSGAETKRNSKFFIQFDQLFSDLAKNRHSLPNYYQILSEANLLRSFYETDDNEEIQVSNFPQLRLPRSEIFSIEALNNLTKNPDYVVISKVQAQTQEQFLNIPQQAKAIFLYTPIIPFKLILPAKPQTTQRMVCMDDSDAYHFSEIDASGLTLPDLCKLCAPLSAVREFYFYIDKLTLTHEKTVLYNCLLKMFKGSDQTFDFELIGKKSGDQNYLRFSAQTDINSLARTTIEITNYKQEELVTQPAFEEMPTELTLEPFREKIGPILQKKAKEIQAGK